MQTKSQAFLQKWLCDYVLNLSKDFGAWATENENSTVASTVFSVESTKNILESKVTSDEKNEESSKLGQACMFKKLSDI